MNFCWTTMTINDMEESLAFYEGVLGLIVQRRFSPNDNIEIAFLGQAGQAQVELICNKHLADKLKENPHRGSGISLGFQVDSLNDALELVKEKGIAILRGPIRVNPTTQFFFVNDPNGYEIQLVEIS
ncbi:MAG: VOC family protein [Bacillota bacterium]